MRPSLLLLLAVLGGCVSGYYRRDSLNEPVPPAALEALEPGRDTLATCLAALGAPLRVLEYRVAPDRTAGMALVWFWRDTAGWGFDVSAPIDDRSADVFEFDLADTELPGCVLWFGPDLVLERWRQGMVGELLPGRVRPSPAVDG